MFPENYDAICEAYKTAMGHLFKNISVTNNNLLTQKQRYTRTIEDTSGQWFIEKNAKGIPPLERNTLGKKPNKRMMKLNLNCMMIIGGGMIGDSNYIGTCLNGFSRLVLKIQVKCHILFHQLNVLRIKILKQHVRLVIQILKDIIYWTVLTENS